MSFLKRGSFLSVQEGEVIAVDKVNWSCTVATEQGLHEDVPIAPVYLNLQGSGVFYLPEIGTRVYLASPRGATGSSNSGPAGGTTSFILCGAIPVMGKEDDNDEGATETGDKGREYTGTPDYRGDRPVLDPGDIVLSSTGGNFCILRGGGTLEIGSSQIARRYYIPIQNMIRDIASIYELNSAGGKMSWYTRRGELTDGETIWGEVTEEVLVDPDEGTKETVTIQKTPTVFEMNLKEFAQDQDSIISLKMGRIEVDGLEEHGLHPTAGASDILFEFNINDNFKVWIDRYGNFQKHFLGSETTCFEADQKIFYAAGLTQEVTGRLDNLLGGRNVQIEDGDDYLSIKNASKFVRVDRGIPDHTDGRGSLYTQVGGDIGTECLGTHSLVTGEAKHEVNGSYTLDTLNFAVLDIGGDLNVDVTGSTKEVIMQAKQVTINNAQVPPSRKAYDLTAMVGEISFHAVAGTVEITAGSPTGPLPTGSMAPMGKVSVTPLGATMSLLLGAGGVVEVAATGVNLRMGGMEIGVGASGIHLGAVSGAGAGGVVTTLTHPVCYVTGMPIMGSPIVGVVAPAPTPGAVVVSATTSTYAEKVEIA